MQSIKEQSLIVSAIRVLKDKKEPVEFYTLFTLLCDEKGYSNNERAELITRFYSDITTSAKFVYTGDNNWDLKEHQKTELWEKDGSYFKEYTEIKSSDYTDLNLVEPAPKPKKTRAKKVKVAKAKVAKAKVEEVKVEEVKAEEPVVTKAKVEEVPNAPKEVAAAKVAGEEGFVEYDEEVVEEFEDDFDEDKYNEYMDTYEDQYKD